MGRSKQYANAAERQKAYRQRLAAARPSQLSLKPPRHRSPSRPARLVTVENEVRSLHDEYEHWLNSLPDSLEQTEQASRLTETVEQLEGVLDLLTEIQPPRGFGRD